MGIDINNVKNKGKNKDLYMGVSGKNKRGKEDYVFTSFCLVGKRKKNDR